MPVWRYFTIALAAAIAPMPTSAQDSRMVSCKLVVDAEEYINGACRFSPIDSDGSFQIMSGNGQYFAQVLIDSPGLGTGYWNGERYASHAHSHLGELTRQDACWVNNRASVCAW